MGQFLADNLRCRFATATRINPQHDRFYRVIVARLLNPFQQRQTANGSGACIAIDNAPHCGDDGNFVLRGFGLYGVQG